MVVSEDAPRVAITCALTIAFAILPAVFLSAQPAGNPDARASALATGLDWLGRHSEPDREFTVREPLWQGPGSMFIEQQVARGVIRGWWPERLADPQADAILDGFAAYLQSRIVEDLFDRRHLRTAHSVETKPYFGNHLIWSFPTLRLSRHALIGRDRHAALFDALERWLGTPTLQAAMFEVAHLHDEQLTADVIIKTISDAAAQDLSWVFEAASNDVSYAVDSISGTSVTVSRRGSGMFTGRSAQRVGAFDSGDGVRLKVVLADGSSSFATWDGRDETRTFTFTSAPVAAYLDPERLITLDRNRIDNAIVKPSPTNVPVGKWAARWLVWLQHTMLSYGFLA